MTILKSSFWAEDVGGSQLEVIEQSRQEVPWMRLVVGDADR